MDENPRKVRETRARATGPALGVRRVQGALGGLPVAPLDPSRPGLGRGWPAYPLSLAHAMCLVNSLL